MKNTICIAIIAAVLASMGCQSNQKQASNTDSTSANPDSLAVVNSTQIAGHKGDSISTNSSPDLTVLMVKNYLQTAFKDDIAKGILDTLSRKFLIKKVNLNDDGKEEIFVGLTGPYFCGSGGCTFLLLTHNGSLVTRFTVSDYPLIVAPEETNGWRDLLVQSRGVYHRLKYDGTKYPSNPSIEPVEKVLPVKEVNIVFDIANSKPTWFEF